MRRPTRPTSGARPRRRGAALRQRRRGERLSRLARALGARGTELAVLAPAAQGARARLEAPLGADAVDQLDRVAAQRGQLLGGARGAAELVREQVVPDQADRSVAAEALGD